MRGYNVISELYHGNLRPCDRGFRNDTDFAITMEAFVHQEGKLRELLTGESAQRFDELVSCHNSIVDTMSYENFKTGLPSSRYQTGQILPSDFFSRRK